VKYLEKDEQILEKGRQNNPTLSEKLETTVESLSMHMKKTLDTYPEALISDHRYGFINGILKQGVIQYEHDQSRLYTSDSFSTVWAIFCVLHIIISTG
jgi:ferrous iron transport protein B